MTVYEQNPDLYHRLSETHPLMIAARGVAMGQSLDLKQKVGVVLARMDLDGPTAHGDLEILGVGANGSTYHAEHGCKRLELGCKSGEGYDLCPGCSPENHAEATAIRNAIGRRTALGPGVVAIMWGHWWACGDCWARLRAVGVDRIYLLFQARAHFDPASPYFVFKGGA